MVILNGFVSKGSESYADRRITSTSYSDKIKADNKLKKYYTSVDTFWN